MAKIATLLLWLFGSSWLLPICASPQQQWSVPILGFSSLFWLLTIFFPSIFFNSRNQCVTFALLVQCCRPQRDSATSAETDLKMAVLREAARLRLWLHNKIKEFSALVWVGYQRWWILGYYSTSVNGIVVNTRTVENGIVADTSTTDYIALVLLNTSTVDSRIVADTSTSLSEYWHRWELDSRRRGFGDTA